MELLCPTNVPHNAVATCAIIAYNVLQFLHANVFETIHEAKVLQPMTSFSRITWRSTCVDLRV